MGSLQVKILILLNKLIEKDFEIIQNMEENCLALNYNQNNECMPW